MCEQDKSEKKRGRGRPPRTGDIRPTAWIGTHATDLEKAELRTRWMREGQEFGWSQWLRSLLGLTATQRKVKD